MRISMTVGMVVLVVALFVEGIRPIPALWTASDLLPRGLAARLEQVAESCDAVIVLKDNPGVPDFMNEVDATIFATLSGIPTPQGYSRASPVGLPSLQGDGSELIASMRALGFAGTVCRLSSSEIQFGG
jgi:hypothetical protein